MNGTIWSIESKGFFKLRKTDCQDAVCDASEVNKKGQKSGRRTLELGKVRITVPRPCSRGMPDKLVFEVFSPTVKLFPFAMNSPYFRIVSITEVCRQPTDRISSNSQWLSSNAATCFISSATVNQQFSRFLRLSETWIWECRTMSFIFYLGSSHCCSIELKDFWEIQDLCWTSNQGPQANRPFSKVTVLLWYFSFIAGAKTESDRRSMPNRDWQFHRWPMSRGNEIIKTCMIWFCVPEPIQLIVL